MTLVSLQSLKPADIIVVEPFDSAYDIATGLSLARSMIYLGRGTVVGSDKAGVRAYSLRTICSLGIEAAVFRPISPTFSDLTQKICDSAQIQVGRRYELAEDVFASLNTALPRDAHYRSMLVSQAYRNADLLFSSHPAYCDADAIRQSAKVKRIGHIASAQFHPEDIWKIESEVSTSRRLCRQVSNVLQIEVDSIDQLIVAIKNHPAHDRTIASLIRSSGYFFSSEWNFHHHPSGYHIDGFLCIGDLSRRQQLVSALLELENENLASMDKLFRAITTLQFNQPTESACLLIASERRRMTLANQRITVLQHVLAVDSSPTAQRAFLR